MICVDRMLAEKGYRLIDDNVIKITQKSCSSHAMLINEINRASYQNKQFHHEGEI